MAFVCGGGGSLPGRSQLVRQLRGDGSGQPVQPLGASCVSDQFGVTMDGLDIQGRARVKLEVEHCPNGVPFGSGSCVRATSASWNDAGAGPNGTGLSLDLASVPSGLRRWRARTLVAPFHVTEPGITASPHPAHGPWRRPQGQAFEGDLRVTAVTVAVEIRDDPSGFAIEHLVNPTRGRIDFTAVLPGDGPARVELFDVAGRSWLARELPLQGTTRRQFRWDVGRSLASGTYFLRLSQGGRSVTARVVVLH
jgi:hypothetical protein